MTFMAMQDTLIANKQADILLLQHNNPYAIVLERQIFSEAIENGTLNVKCETEFKGIEAFLSKRKIQKFIGKNTASWILDRTILGNYLKDAKKSKKEPIVLFLNSVFTEIRYPVDALLHLKKEYGAIFILYYIDTIGRGVSIYANYLREKGVFDLIYTFDKCDAYKYGLMFWETPYSKMSLNVSNNIDLYFCGVDTDRVDMIQAISRVPELDYSMDLIEVSGNGVFEGNNRIILHSVKDIMPYKEALEKTLKANCILEIVRPGQVGFTLRVFEAVVYNKKLLTNNESITEFPFYNSKYMRVFKKIDEIDWKWVESKDEVDYHYDGSFSPLKFIEEISNKACQIKGIR